MSAPRMRKRKVAKALEGTEKTAFLAQRTVDTVDEWYALEDAHELARMGMRYSLISELTGIPEATTRRLTEEAGVAVGTTGRVARTMRLVMHEPLRHLSASLFARWFIRLLEESDWTWKPHFLVVIHRIVMDRAFPPPFSAEDAWVVALHLYERKIFLHPACGTCGVPFLKSPEPILIGTDKGVGSCPTCRLIAPGANRAQTKSRTTGKAAEALERILKPKA